MNTQLTSAKEVIARIEHDLTIDFSDWIAKAPLWIADGLAQLDTTAVWEDAHEEIEIESYKGTLPCNIKMLRGIDYDGLRLTSRHRIPSPFYDRQWLYMSGESYEIYGDRNIITSFEEGTVTVLFRRPATEHWQSHNIYLPKVPDNPFVFEALKWFIMMRILQKGTKHPVYSLNNNNEFTNPGLAWTKYSRIAKNNINRMSPDQRLEAGEILRTFIVDINYNADINYPTKAGSVSDQGTFTEEFTETFD